MLYIMAALGVSAQIGIAAYIFHKLHLRWTSVFIAALIVPILMDVFIPGDITILRMTFFFIYGTSALIRALYLQGVQHAIIAQRADHEKH